jgi:hypothetical protein
MSKEETMVERCAEAVKAKLFELRHRMDTMGFEEIALAVIDALMEPDGQMWSAGRKAFDNEAEKWRSADRYEQASAIADRAPEIIYRAMLSKAKEGTG